MGSDDLALIACIRGPIVHEYADGNIAVRFGISAEEAPTFFAAFPDSNEPVFLASATGTIEATRGPIIGERRDGSLSVKIIIEAAHKQRFRELWPTPDLAAVLARADPETGRKRMVAEAAAPPAFGHLARVLRLHADFMLNRRVWEAVGTDADYLEWCRRHPCAKCHWTPHFEMDTEMLCEAAHVRRIADGAGTGIKPAYSAIPLCHACHSAQHMAGESYLGGKAAVDKLRITCVQGWVWETLKAKLGFAHWSEVPPETLHGWALSHDLAETLPDCYRV